MTWAGGLPQNGPPLSRSPLTLARSAVAHRNDVSMHGSPQIPTPKIDGLAASGIRLNKYYVNPVCSPTRASLMSGRSVIHHGVFTPYGMGIDSSGLNLTYTLLPEHLKAAHGYSTYMVGKVSVAHDC
jgi:arylsulfatase B